MYWPDTNTGVDIEPARKPVASAVRKFFTEGGVGQAPTVPGGDWFNQVTNELLSVVSAADLEPSKTEDDQLLQAINVLANQSASSLRTKVQIKFNTISALTSATAPNVQNGDIATTSGYYAAGDGGGATYLYLSDSTATPDGFLVHNSAAGGRWLLVEKVSDIPAQVAGAVLDGVTDGRAALLAVLASNRSVMVTGIWRVSGAAIDLAPYVSSQQLKFGIQGDDPIGAQLLFDSGNGGLFSSTFFRGSCMKNIHIKNAAMDMTGVGFINNPGAEMMDWENVTFTGWHCGFSIHTWNSSFKNIASRSCYFPGALYGTSQKNGSFYALRCVYAWALGLAYTGGLTGSLALPGGGLALSYSELGAFAADECGPYMFGRCFNVNITSIGAERSIGPYIIDFSLYSPAASRQNIILKCLDVYVQDIPLSAGVLAIIGPIANAYGSFVIDTSNCYSDRNIPFISGDGRGLRIVKPGYNSSATKPMTSSDTNGFIIDEPLLIGSDYSQLPRVGYKQGRYDQVRKVKAFMSLPVAASARLVLRIQDTAVTGLEQGVFVCGKATFHPVHKGGNNAAREGGVAVFSVAADFAGGLASINLQKLGSLAGLTATNRLTGTVQELAFALPAAAAQYFCELEFWGNGKFSADNVTAYYVES